MRDIEHYSEKYSEHGFEEYKVLYRRKKLLEIIDRFHPKNILEIGCGNEPLFLYVDNVNFTVVEAAPDFYENAVALAENRNETINIIKGFFEEAAPSLSDNYDMIICASLLHEVERPGELLDAIVKVCSSNTIVNIIVPNANSMHRLLGKEIGMLSDVHDMSRNNIDFQQNIVFDRNSLIKIVLERGMEIVDEGSFFVKPFSHEQMYEMTKTGILNDEVLDGLYVLGENDMAEFASEIYVNCRVKNGGVNDKQREI